MLIMFQKIIIYFQWILILQIQVKIKIKSFLVNSWWIYCKLKKKEFEIFLNAQKEKEINLKLDLKKLENELNKLDETLMNERREEKEIINKLMQYYKETLLNGKNVKKRWISLDNKSNMVFRRKCSTIFHATFSWF